MVGLFINTLPLRMRLPPAQAAARAAAGGAGQPVAADGAPASRPCRDPGAGRIGRAVRHAGGVRELSGRPRRACGRRRRSAAHRRRAGTMPRTIRSAWRPVRASGCSCGCDYRPDLFDRSSVEAIAGRLVRLLEAAVARSGACDRQPRHSGARRASHHPAGVERDRARDPVRHAAGAVCGAGCAHARGGRGGVRGAAA